MKETGEGGTKSLCEYSSKYATLSFLVLTIYRRELRERQRGEEGEVKNSDRIFSGSQAGKREYTRPCDVPIAISVERDDTDNICKLIMVFFQVRGSFVAEVFHRNKIILPSK